MNAPDKIYLQVCGDCPKADCKNCKFESLEDNVTWSKDKIFGGDVEYIRKDALIEWLKQKRFDLTDKPDDSAYQKVIDKLNEM